MSKSKSKEVLDSQINHQNPFYLSVQGYADRNVPDSAIKILENLAKENHI